MGSSDFNMVQISRHSTVSYSEEFGQFSTDWKPYYTEDHINQIRIIRGSLVPYYQILPKNVKLVETKSGLLNTRTDNSEVK